MSKLYPLFSNIKERHVKFLSHLEVLIDHVIVVTKEAENIRNIVDEHHKKVSTVSRAGFSVGVVGSLFALAAAPFTVGASLIPFGVGCATAAAGATIGVGATAYDFHHAEDKLYEVMKLVEDVERECTSVQGEYYYLQNNFEQVGETVMGMLPTTSSKSVTFEQRAALGLALTRHLIYNHKNVFKRINMMPVVEYPNFDIVGTSELYTSLFQTVKLFQKILDGKGVLRDLFNIGQAMLTGDKINEVSTTITNIVHELQKLCVNMKEHHSSLKIE